MPMCANVCQHVSNLRFAEVTLVAMSVQLSSQDHTREGPPMGLSVVRDAPAPTAAVTAMAQERA